MKEIVGNQWRLDASIMSLGGWGKRWPRKVDSFVENLVDFLGLFSDFLDES